MSSEKKASERRIAKQMPAGWDPPFPAWSAQFDPLAEHTIIGYFAVQTRSSDVASFVTWITKCFASSNGPLVINRGRFTDSAGYHNEVFIAYWSSPDCYKTWQRDSRFTDWWESPDRLDEAAGYWREVLVLPRDRLETIFSSRNPAGAAKLGTSMGEPVREHGYWGGARDRLPIAAGDQLESPLGATLAEPQPKLTAGRRVRVTPPENLCVIRSAQDWTRCGGAELETYMSSVHPVLIQGMDFLRDNPVATGCCACRFMNDIDDAGKTQDKSFGMAYFLSLGHMEKWAKSHATHLAIFGRFLAMAQKHNMQLDLQLWHEVAVLPQQEQLFEYVNCHPGTGLLPFFDSQNEA